MIKQHFGLYEKALPRDLELKEKLRLAKEIGFDYFEMSTDETEAFKARVTMSREEKQALQEAMREYEMPIWTMCLSGTRNCPLGSEDAAQRAAGMELTRNAIHFAAEMGIRIVQVMAYDEYYGERNERTHAFFLDNLRECTREAASCGVMLALENVDIETMDTLEKGLDIVKAIDSPWLQIYPDVANLYATGKGNEWAREQYRTARNHIVASHVKDTVVGTVRDIAFGAGEVDFIPFFQLLHEIDFHGPCTLEFWDQNDGKAIETAKDAIAFIKDKYERSL